MAFATKLPTLGRRTITVSRPFALRAQQAMRLNKPMVFQMLRPAPVRGNDLSGFGEDAVPPEPSAWDSANKAIASLSTVVGAGTKFYTSREETKSLQQQADMADAKAAAAQQKADVERQYMLETQRAAQLVSAGRPAPSGMPSWVLPVAIGGVLLAAVGGFFLLRKKA
jgi:hypothetical protein